MAHLSPGEYALTDHTLRLRVLKVIILRVRTMMDDLMLSNGNVCGNERGSVLPSSIQKAGRDSDSLTMTPNGCENSRAAMPPSDTNPVKASQTGEVGGLLVTLGGPDYLESRDVAIVNINSIYSI